MSRMFPWAYGECWFDRQVDDNTPGICPMNTSGMIHHNNLTAAASKNTSTIHHQSKLSSLLSSTAWVYFGELYRLKNWIWCCITRTALWVFPWLIQNVTGPVLPPGHPQSHSCAWEALCECPCLTCTVAYRRHVTSTLPPDVLHHRCPTLNKVQPAPRVESAPPSHLHSFLVIAWWMKRTTPAGEITTVSACILYRMQVKQK